MESFMNTNNTENSFRFNRSASLSDLNNYTTENDLHFDMLNLEDTTSDINRSAKYFSSNQLYSPVVPTADLFGRNTNQNQSVNWNSSSVVAHSSIHKTNSYPHIYKEVDQKVYVNGVYYSRNVKYLGPVEDCGFNMNKMIAAGDTQNNGLKIKDYNTFEATPMEVDGNLECNIQKKEYNSKDSLAVVNDGLQMEWEGIEEGGVVLKKRKVCVVKEDPPLTKGYKLFRKCNWVKFVINISVLFGIIYTVQWGAPLYDTRIGVVDNIIKFSTIISGVQLEYCKNVYDTTPLEKELRENLYGQTDVVKNLPEYLNFIDNFQLLVFTGGTGVGKTFTKSMIMDTFLWKSNIQHFSSMSYLSKRSERVQVYRKMNNCGYNLIIVDDMVLDDNKNIFDFIEHLYGISKDRNLKTVVILIYNIQDMPPPGQLEVKVDVDGRTQDIVQKFQDRFERYFEPRVLKFQLLKLKSLIKCVNFVAKTFSFLVPKEVVEEIALNLHSGCKLAEKRLLLWRTQQKRAKK